MKKDREEEPVRETNRELYKNGGSWEKREIHLWEGWGNSIVLLQGSQVSPVSPCVKVSVNLKKIELSQVQFLVTDSEVPGSIPGATRFSEKQWVWNGDHSAS
jgi:hypothetical protein